MRESNLNQQARKRILERCPGAWVIKHADRFTAGIPDTSVSWQGYTTWLEFKVLRRSRTVQEALDPDQALMCRHAERATGGRCWVVAFREKETVFYRPSRIAQQPTPVFSTLEEMAELTWLRGATTRPRHCYEGIVALIHQTHRL